MVYLITYSRADKSKKNLRKSFANVIVKTFENQSRVKILHWAVSEEQHHIDTESHVHNSTHYHMAIKLNKKFSILKASWESKLLLNQLIKHTTVLTSMW